MNDWVRAITIALIGCSIVYGLLSYYQESLYRQRCTVRGYDKDLGDYSCSFDTPEEADAWAKWFDQQSLKYWQNKLGPKPGD